MKKKTLAIFAITLCAAMLAGCSGEKTSSGNTGDKSSGDVSVSTPNESKDSSSAEGSSTVSSGESSESTGDTESSDTVSSEEESSEGGHYAGVDGVMTNGQVVVDIDHETLGNHTWGISLYGGGTGSNYAAYVNEFKERVGSGVNVYSMVVPTAGAYYLPTGYEDYNASHRDSINSIANKLVNVINVDGYGALARHTDEYIYTRTDHHWMPLGAYYAAKEFCETAMVECKDLSTYEKEVVEGFVGTMYAFTDYNERINNDPDTFTYYIPSTDYYATYYTTDFQIDKDVEFYHSIFVEQPPSGSYSTFMGGDMKIVKIESEGVDNGRKLCVFKDSYGNAEIPFYIDAFEEVYVCDVRYFDTDAVSFIQENGITDVLFTMCTFSAVGENAEGIKNNLLS